MDSLAVVLTQELSSLNSWACSAEEWDSEVDIEEREEEGSAAAEDVVDLQVQLKVTVSSKMSEV